MRLFDVSSLVEMAGPAQTCPKCGQGPMSKTHHWYQGAWKCKAANVAAFNAAQGGAPAATPAATRQPKAATPPLPTRPFAEQAREWLTAKGVENATVSDDGVITASDDVVLSGLRLRALPAKFDTVAGDFTLIGGLVESFRNFPESVGGALYLGRLGMTDLKGCPSKIGDSLSLHDLENLKSLETDTPIECKDLTISIANLKSLKNIHKTFKRVDGKIKIGLPINDSVLGLLSIKGVKSVELHFSNRDVATILNKQLSSDDKDIHVAQEELIDGGFAAFARL